MLRLTTIATWLLGAKLNYSEGYSQIVPGGNGVQREAG